MSGQLTSIESDKTAIFCYLVFNVWFLKNDLIIILTQLTAFEKPPEKCPRKQKNIDEMDCISVSLYQWYLYRFRDCSNTSSLREVGRYCNDASPGINNRTIFNGSNVIRDIIRIRKLAPPSQPIRCKTKTNRDLVTRVLRVSGRLHVVHVYMYLL